LFVAGALIKKQKGRVLVGFSETPRCPFSGGGLGRRSAPTAAGGESQRRGAGGKARGSEGESHWILYGPGKKKRQPLSEAEGRLGLLLTRSTALWGCVARSHSLRHRHEA